MKILSPLDIGKNELRNAVIQNLASAPSTPLPGQIFYNTASGKFTFYNGSTWLEPQIGGVTSVALSLPNIFSVGGSEVTSTGTLSATLVSQTANTVFAAPTGSAGAPAFRLLVAADLAAVTGYRLDQFAVPTSSVSFNGQTLTNVGTPSLGTDAANKNYVDNIASGTKWKNSVRAISTTNITLSGTQTVDGVALIVGNRVLVAGQSTPSQNGFYLVAAGAWARTTDVAANSLAANIATFIEEGTVYADSQWVCTANSGSDVVGTNNLTFVQIGGGITYTGGTGITVTGTVITVNAAYTGQISITTLGTITTGTWSGSTIAVDKGGTGAVDAPSARANLSAAGKFSQTIGNGAATDITITHNLNSRDVVVSFREVATNFGVIVDWEATTVNAVVARFTVAPTSNAIAVTILG